ncbi:hypothetical protein RJT34_25031 [Clitoria ternatea]|uniref:Clavata3/ESR (CLE) gene family member n=1 Tax=Clitoria ternatea TaxID=43366 RepID=A0AAN9IIJ5_CLITE
MRVPKFSALLMLLIFLLSLMEGSTSRLDNNHEELEKSSERKLSSMFIQSYSAILSLKNSRKSNKFKEIHVVSHRLVPTGPNPLHN